MPLRLPHPLPGSRGGGAALVALLFATGAGLVGCSSVEPLPAHTAPSPSGPVIQPGRPGEPNATLTGTAAAPVVTPTTNPADASFFQDMIVHHSQAIVMVDSTRGRLTDPQVARLADRIGDEQGPEIAAMAGWLKQHRQEVPIQAKNPRLGNHKDHQGMPGMATPAELQKLADVKGVAVDQMFLQLMIRHHKGALVMISEHGKRGSDDFVTKMATEIDATQSKQIQQMQLMLQGLS